MENKHKWRIYRPFPSGKYWFVRPPVDLPYGITFHVTWKAAMEHVEYIMRNME